MRKQQRGTGLERDLDVRVERSLRQIGHQHGDQVGALDRVNRLGDRQAIAPGLLPAGATLAHADDDVESAVLQIQRVRPTLTAVAEHGNARTLERLLVDVLSAIQMHRFNTP